MKTRLSILALLVAAALPCLQACGDWTSFRNGGSSSAEKLPTNWSPDDIAWQLELTGYGQSTPVILGEKVFVASVVGPMKEDCLVQCFDLKSGSELWQFSCPSTKRVPSNYMASRAAPTPVVDGKGLYVFFETGDLVALDLAGKKLWQRVLSEEFGDFENNHGLGSSPAQNDSHLFLNLEHKGPSHLVALNKSNGETEWTVDRPSGSSWSSPIVVNSEGSAQVLVSSAGAVTSYDASSGKKFGPSTDWTATQCPPRLSALASSSSELVCPSSPKKAASIPTVAWISSVFPAELQRSSGKRRKRSVTMRAQL